VGEEAAAVKEAISIPSPGAARVTYYSLVVLDILRVSVLPFRKASSGCSPPASSQLMATGWLLRLVVASDGSVVSEGNELGQGVCPT